MSDLILRPQDWGTMKEQAAVLVKSGLLPQGVDTPEKAIAIAIKGHEMGIPMMQAFSHISIIQGKPCISAELMMGQIYKNCPGAKVNILENTSDKAVIEAARPGGKFATFSFTKEDAMLANLTGKGTWKQYPKVMLLWRAISQMARTMFPDCIMGASYTPEELGAEIDSEGEVISVVAVDSAGDAVSTKKEETKKESKKYLGTTEQQALVADILKNRGVPEEYWGAINEKMIGKYGKDLPGIINDVVPQTN